MTQFNSIIFFLPSLSLYIRLHKKTYFRNIWNETLDIEITLNGTFLVIEFIVVIFSSFTQPCECRYQANKFSLITNALLEQQVMVTSTQSCLKFDGLDFEYLNPSL